MNDASPIKTAALNAATKVYYVLKRDPSWSSTAYAKSTEAANWKGPAGLSRTYGVLNEAIQFPTVASAIENIKAVGNSDVNAIVRVEETAGTPSRQIVSPCDPRVRNAKWAVQAYGTDYLKTDGSNYAGSNYGADLNGAYLFSDESDAITAVARAAAAAHATPHGRNIVRVIEVPATPVITETVLA